MSEIIHEGEDLVIPAKQVDTYDGYHPDRIIGKIGPFEGPLNDVPLHRTNEELFALAAELEGIECPRCQSSNYASVEGTKGRCFDCGFPQPLPVVPEDAPAVTMIAPAEQLPSESIGYGHSDHFDNPSELAPPDPEVAKAAREALFGGSK